MEPRKSRTLKIYMKKNLGVTGQVLMNNKAIRVPSYATYHTKNGSMRIVGKYVFIESNKIFKVISGSVIIVELTARLGDKLKCAMSEHDCSEHVSFGLLKEINLMFKLNNTFCLLLKSSTITSDTFKWLINGIEW